MHASSGLSYARCVHRSIVATLKNLPLSQYELANTPVDSHANASSGVPQPNLARCTSGTHVMMLGDVYVIYRIVDDEQSGTTPTNSIPHPCHFCVTPALTV
jgi:hypothetical protein